VGYYVAGPALLFERCPSLLRAPVSEMTYTVSSGTLNSTIQYDTVGLLTGMYMFTSIKIRMSDCTCIVVHGVK